MGTRRQAFGIHRNSFRPLKIDIGNGVSIGNSGIIVSHPWPSSIILALPGRRVEAVIDHPELQDVVINRVNFQVESFTLVVSPVEPDRAA